MKACLRRAVAMRYRQGGSISFFKERNKKLLPIGMRGPIQIGLRMPMGKSFLVLFFKKELLPWLLALFLALQALNHDNQDQSVPRTIAARVMV